MCSDGGAGEGSDWRGCRHDHGQSSLLFRNVQDSRRDGDGRCAYSWKVQADVRDVYPNARHGLVPAYLL